MANTDLETNNLKLQLPDADNPLIHDVARIIQSLKILDTATVLNATGTGFAEGKQTLFLPSLLNVTNEEDMLASAAVAGDVAKIGSKYYVLLKAPATEISNWIVFDGTVQMNMFSANTPAELKLLTAARRGDLALVGGKSHYMLIADNPASDDNWLNLQSSAGVTVYSGATLAAVIGTPAVVDANPGDIAKTTNEGNWMLLAVPGTERANWFQMMSGDAVVKLQSDTVLQTVLSNLGLAVSSVDKKGRLRLSANGAKQSVIPGANGADSSMAIEFDVTNNTVALIGGKTGQYRISISETGIIANTDMAFEIPE